MTARPARHRRASIARARRLRHWAMAKSAADDAKKKRLPVAIEMISGDAHDMPITRVGDAYRRRRVRRLPCHARLTRHFGRQHTMLYDAEAF